MNSVNFIGRLVADPELRFTPNGKAVANVRVAVNGAGAFISEKDGYKAGFFSVVVWGKQAESLADYCRQGREVAISGRLAQRDYDGEHGTVYVTEVIAERIDFLREPKEAEQADEPSPRRTAREEKPKRNQGGGARGGNSRGR